MFFGFFNSSGFRADEEASSVCRCLQPSAVYNDMLNELQKLEEDLHRIHELIRRNDTR